MVTLGRTLVVDWEAPCVPNVMSVVTLTNRPLGRAEGSVDG